LSHDNLKRTIRYFNSIDCLDKNKVYNTIDNDNDQNDCDEDIGSGNGTDNDAGNGNDNGFMKNTPSFPFDEGADGQWRVHETSE
jgi:hypothetical protein